MPKAVFDDRTPRFVLYFQATEGVVGNKEKLKQSFFSAPRAQELGHSL